MTLPGPQTAPHEARFLAMLNDAFHRFGVAGGLPARLREAVAATPRHRFVHRFRVADGPLRDNDAEPEENLSVIYSDAVMRHVDAAGEPLPSSNSQPSYILYLLHLLNVERGHAVLEVGSGSGWLAAVMAHLAGPQGRVVGVELISGLAAQGRADLAALGIGNVQVVTGDGTKGYADAAPYDRAIVTAATWAVPPPLLDQVAEGGLALVPVELRSGDGCDVTLLRRQGHALVAEHVVPGWFVPLLGESQDRAALPRHALPGAAAERFALPLGMADPGSPSPVAAQFRAFLGRTEPAFIGPQTAQDGWPIEVSTPPFGLSDEPSGSTALWQAGEIVCFGGRAAASRLAHAYARWAALGLPGADAFRLEVHCADAAPAATDRLWVEPRGHTVLAWRLRPGVGNWQALRTTANDGQ